MNELILLFAAFFIFCFGSLILSEVFRFGFAVADKLLENSGRILRAPFKVVFKLMSLVFKFGFKKLKTNQDEYSVRPIQITPLELQQMRNHQLRAGNKNVPVEIEYTQPKLNKGI